VDSHQETHITLKSTHSLHRPAPLECQPVFATEDFSSSVFSTAPRQFMSLTLATLLPLERWPE